MGFLNSLPAILQWLQLGKKVFDAGKPALDAVLAAAASHGAQVDTDELNAIILDDAKRKAEADAETQATS